MPKPTSLISGRTTDSGRTTPFTSFTPSSTSQGDSSSRQTSPKSKRKPSAPGSRSDSRAGQVDGTSRIREEESGHISDDIDAYEMDTMNDRPTGGQSNVPLLSDDKYNRRSHGSNDRPFLVTRGSHLHARNPKYPQPQDQTRRKYIYAALCLVVALVSFVVQTETAVYIQHELKWNKAYCMLWLTHGSWTFLWPIQLLFLRLANRKQSWPAFWRRHKALLRSTAQMVQHRVLHLSSSKASVSPWRYMARTTAYVTTFLTVAGASWYVAINLTSPSDLTAIYNCSAFFAYVFSIILLKDKFRLDKIFSVGLAIVGVLVVAYGDTENPDSHPKTPGHSGGSTNPAPEGPPDNRLVGNLIIGVGSVLYGLYEVLYKKYACPPDGTSPNRGMIFANTFGSMVGIFTLTVLWIPLPILHFTGIERFELPRGQAAYLLTISTLSNAVFSGSFLVLMSLTSPVLSSVAALLTIFIVAITDWFITGKPLSPAAIGGGTLIIIAFLMLSWATYREMNEEAAKREVTDEHKILSSSEDEDEDEGGLGQHKHNHSHRRDGVEDAIDDGEHDAERGRRSRGSTIVIRGDESEADDDDNEDDGDRYRQKRRHRES